MSDRRMFSKTITDSDAFLDMPLSTQALYFHLSMKADDDGFVNNPRRIQRTIGASDDDLKLLIAKSFILTFESGVIVIKHWRINNWIRSDRKIATNYTEELDMLRIKENGAYSLESQQISEVQPLDNQTSTKCQPNDTLINLPLSNYPNPISSSKSKSEHKDNIISLLDVSELDIEVKEKVREWVTYKSERKEGYKSQGFKSLLSQISNKVQEIGIRRVCHSIDVSMASNWAGIHYDTDRDNKSHTGSPADIVDSWI